MDYKIFLCTCICTEIAHVHVTFSSYLSSLMYCVCFVPGDQF